MQDDTGTGTLWADTQGLVPVPVPQAARVLGISDRAVRKRITAGSIPAKRDGRQWTVYIPAVPCGAEPVPSDPYGTESVPETGTKADAGGTSAVPELVQLIRDQEQKITELAGQVGYLQSELSRTREQLQLAAPVRTDTARSRCGSRSRRHGRPGHRPCGPCTRRDSLCR